MHMNAHRAISFPRIGFAISVTSLWPLFPAGTQIVDNMYGVMVMPWEYASKHWKLSRAQTLVNIRMDGEPIQLAWGVNSLEAAHFKWNIWRPGKCVSSLIFIVSSMLEVNFPFVSLGIATSSSHSTLLCSCLPNACYTLLEPLRKLPIIIYF